ncbi:MAG TPA: zf-HC2 domain-containing protein [Planctomycetota bacterium]|nr:zf-HC2 domain-containing protein [Planctomycetota bacterium]
MKHQPDSPDRSSEASACSRARLEASAWIDGELPDASEFLTHLETCGACRDHAEQLRVLRERLEPLRACEPVADLWPRIAARAASTAPAARGWSLRLRYAAALFVGFAVTAGLLELASRWNHPEQKRFAESSPRWPAALHEDPTDAEALRTAPEQRLLASFDRTPGTQR